MNKQIAECLEGRIDNLIPMFKNATLNEVQIKTEQGIIHMLGELPDSETYEKDVSVILDTCIGLVSELESDGLLSKNDASEFDGISTLVLQAQELMSPTDIVVGALTVYEGLPYQIDEIDYDDFSVHISSGELDDNGLWVSPVELGDKKKEGFTDYNEFIKPMIADLKDGSDEPLTSGDIDGLMRVIRAKVEYFEGITTFDGYQSALANAYEY